MGTQRSFCQCYEVCADQRATAMVINKLATIWIAITVLYLLNMAGVGNTEEERIVDMGVEAGKQGLYVATNGSDENPGTEKHPIKTLIEARDRIRQPKRTEGLPKGIITIWILEGRLYFDKTFELSVEDSGAVDCPVVYRAIIAAGICGFMITSVIPPAKHS
ncbi:hypothetical protein ACFL6S_08060 [Candidatus Poribacteria bacterium]